jgi:hypothetical protein
MRPQDGDTRPPEHLPAGYQSTETTDLVEDINNVLEISPYVRSALFAVGRIWGSGLLGWMFSKKRKVFRRSEMFLNFFKVWRGNILRTRRNSSRQTWVRFSKPI